MRVALLTVATGKYRPLAEEMVASARKHLLPGHQVQPFVFTDRPLVRDGRVVPWNAGPWPDGTLRRYHAYAANRELYEACDFVLALDADMAFVAPVREEIVSDLTAVLHPGFVGKRGSYESRPESAAYMAPAHGERYYCGGVVGGRPGRFLELATRIARAVDLDAARGLVAEWHDESHLNRQLWDTPPEAVMPPAYCHPEGCDWFTPTEPARIVARAKNHAELRS